MLTKNNMHLLIVRDEDNLLIKLNSFLKTSLKGMNLDHDFYVLLVNNVMQKMRRRVTKTIFLYKLTNFLLLFICFKLL